ncbi:uncharacterized protein LOC103313276 [Tribolium castaneum]|uniref:uncharacterized protein LOC103313276 n=1 Tax=Tribolium castaneum TaxID=7070 RepID=UPI0030FE79CF
MSSSEVGVEKNENAETKPPTPKKRGRKRKSEITVRQFEEEIDTSPKEETVSRRGRLRKKVNYYELANPDNLEYTLPVQTEINYFSTSGNGEIKIKKKKVRHQEPDFSETSADSKESAKQKDEDNVLSNNEPQKDLFKSTNGKEDDSLLQDLVLEDSTTDFEATTSTPNSKDKRYNYTGETVKMMNKLFSLFANTSDDNSTNNTSNGNNLPNSGKRSGKRQRKDNMKEEDLDDGTGNVTCAICNSTFDKNIWTHHKQRYHNNLAWRVGDPPLDLNDQSFVMHTLNSLYKKKKPLYCDKCGEVKKSVVGFLSHRSQCLKSGEQLESVKISCDLCGRRMLPVSLTTHMKMIHQNPDKEEVPEKTTNNAAKPLPSKRSAAKKAMRIIENVTKVDNKDQYFSANLDLGSQQFAKDLMQKELDETQFIECKFKCNCITTSMEDALSHLNECPEKFSEGFVCKQCLLISSKLEDIIYHIEFAHEINVTVDGDPSYVDKESNKMPSFLQSTVRKTEKCLFPYAFDWTLKFCEENFSDLLFENLKPNWPLLRPETAAQYLPKLEESCDVARIHVTCFTNTLKDSYTYEKYKLFESQIHDDHKITLFCGGPISAMSWLPTPYTCLETSQVLAVSVLNSPDEKYETYQSYEVRSAIQFWNFGQLRNTEASLQKPELVFSLAHDYGPVWHMEWCPSGCYNLEGGRMGLLAVTGSNSVVYIYSIPFFNQELGLFYKPRPVIKLLLQRPGNSLLGGLKYYPCKISWSKSSGHNFIAVGYTNGFVALFNLKTNSVILKYCDDDNVPCILPQKCFQAHSHAITALALYHLNGGCRWLLSASVDRAVNLWDLDDHSYPICTVKKNIITDGFWFNNWLCHVTAPDEGSTTAHVTTMLKQSRDYMFDPNVTLTCSPSTISAISGSDWLNGAVHANAVGEIVGIFPHQMLYTPDQKALKSKRMLFGYTTLIEKNTTGEERVANDKIRKKTLQNLSTKKLTAGIKLSNIKSDFDHSSLFMNEPVLYEEAEQKYALLFCDNKMESYDDFPKNVTKQLTALSKDYGITPPNQYPLNTINKIVFNPNRQASLYYATGYQAGFVRLSWLQFLKSDQQIK